jgi:hypothetical protein
VVNSNCRVHGFNNLYVCDASVFPTSLGVNPQITVMALATMTADHIEEIWNLEYASIENKKILGETCSIKQPMYCSAETLDTMFNELKNELPVESLVNADDRSSSEEKWSFDKNSLMIYNNKYWKGFFPSDQGFAPVRYFGGFWKQFHKEDGIVKGVTHPFEEPVYANNLPQIQKYPGYGEVIYLKYTDLLYSSFYDFLKIIDQDTILGKAFVGVPPFGNQILSFSMSRRYNVDFMTEEDHETIYQHYSQAPENENVVLGKWLGKLVSDSALTPVTQVFDYTKDNLGKLQMAYVFGALLRGISKVDLTKEQMNMYDFTNWHDEVKIVNEEFMVGKWCSQWSTFSLDFGPSFLSVDKDNQGRKRFCLRFTLKRA